MMSFRLKNTARTSRTTSPSRKIAIGALLWGLLAVTMLCVTLAGALRAQFHRSTGNAPTAVPGKFDYYLLSFSWAPEFCALPGEATVNPRECASGRGTGFVLHGLWPEANQGRSPESCGPSKAVSKGLVNGLLPYMLSPGLIQHEWATHGTCTGLTQDDYFTRVLLARATVQIPVQISSIRQMETESPTQIEEQFAGSNPSFPKGAFRTACRNGALTEMRACLDKDLKGRACTVSAGECSSPTVTIRPPR